MTEDAYPLFHVTDEMLSLDIAHWSKTVATPNLRAFERSLKFRVLIASFRSRRPTIDDMCDAIRIRRFGARG